MTMAEKIKALAAQISQEATDRRSESAKLQEESDKKLVESCALYDVSSRIHDILSQGDKP